MATGLFTALMLFNNMSYAIKLHLCNSTQPRNINNFKTLNFSLAQHIPHVQVSKEINEFQNVP